MGKVPIFQEGFDHEAFTQGYRMITEDDALLMYDEMLDETHEDVKIGGLLYATSVALYRVDQVAYRVGFSDFTSDLEADNIYVEGFTEPPKES